MTYSEKQRLLEWIDIVKKNCERTLRSVDLLQNALEEMECEKE